MGSDSIYSPWDMSWKIYQQGWMESRLEDGRLRRVLLVDGVGGVLAWKARSNTRAEYNRRPTVKVYIARCCS